MRPASARLPQLGALAAGTLGATAAVGSEPSGRSERVRPASARLPQLGIRGRPSAPEVTRAVPGVGVVAAVGHGVPGRPGAR
ncbi:hypothetical protein [Streptomyces sp. NPDC051677]|uniref:hypothetical protein n=1 Tax=Streptomyces sp. NPDC051677 TaxID=3365669 RepID=UPI0037D6A0E5